MKKNLWTRAAALCFALVMALSFVLVGCDNEPETPPATTYTVTVVGGTGGGEYEAGESCTVTATIPNGKTFVRWTVGGEEVSTANPYTFTVTGNVTVSAEFQDESSPATTYTVTVVGGTGGGTFEEGESCTVTATIPNGKTFVRWTVGGEEVSTANPYTFTVSANVTLTAQFAAAGQEGAALSLQKSTGGNPIGGFGIGDSTYDDSWTTESTPWQEGEKEGVLTYGGDPAVLVEEVNGVETAYLYVGHDITTAEVTSTYTMPEWICYSSTDLKNWTAESIIMDIEDVPWARGQATGNPEPSAWASQVIKYDGLYWFLFCSWAENTDGYVTAGEGGSMCIGVAVSESPTGPFTCYNQPLVYSSWTSNQDDSFIANGEGTAGWNDIDPTGIVTDTDGDGHDEFYIAWGNSNAFMAQVMVTDVTDDYYAQSRSGSTFTKDESVTKALEIVDQSATSDPDAPVAFARTDRTDRPVYGGDTSHWDIKTESDWDIIKLDLWRDNSWGNTFTEAPYLYEREVDGKTKYYMIYAGGWREALAYSTSDTLWNVTWDYGNRLMDVTATSNTNHPAVFDFGDSTYMIYHNGSLPYGLGYRRVACIAELEFDEDGYISYVAEYSTGLDGVTTKITQGDENDPTYVAHYSPINPQHTAFEGLYPLVYDTLVMREAEFDDINGVEDALWEIEEAKYVPSGENAGNYISIQAYNKAGLYLCYDIATGKVVITQDSHVLGSEEAIAQQTNMSFKTVSGANGVGVMFQCAADSSYYLAIVDGGLVVSNAATAAQRTFRVQTETGNRTWSYEYNEGV